jgi:hypothetical protein
MDINTDELVKRTRVLVIDAYNKERDHICNELERYGFKKDNIFCCTDITEAEEFIDSVHVIFVEASEKKCELRGYNMHGVISKWQNKDKTVFLSAYRNDLGKFTRIAAIYAEQYLPKPLNEFTLMDALDTWSQLAVLEDLIILQRREEINFEN